MANHDELISKGPLLYCDNVKENCPGNPTYLRNGAGGQKQTVSRGEGGPSPVDFWGEFRGFLSKTRWSGDRFYGDENDEHSSEDVWW